MCRIVVRFTQSADRRGVFEYALNVEVTDAIGIPSKIFVYHQSPAGIDGNTFAEFDHVATPVDFQEIPEDAASETVPWYRTNKCTLWLRCASDLILAKQMFVDDINLLRRGYDTLNTANSFDRQTAVDFSNVGVKETDMDKDTIEQEISDMKKDISEKVSKDAMSGIEMHTNTAEGLREAVKIMGNVLGAKIVKSLVVSTLAGLLCGSTFGYGFSGQTVNQIDYDHNPLIVTNVTFDGLATTNAIPIKTSDLTNDVGFVTESITNGLASIGMLPRKASDLTNDVGFVTESVTNGLASKTDIDKITADDVGAYPATRISTFGGYSYRGDKPLSWASKSGNTNVSVYVSKDGVDVIRATDNYSYYESANFYSDGIRLLTLSGNNFLRFPYNSGTLALTSDIPEIPPESDSVFSAWRTNSIALSVGKNAVADSLYGLGSVAFGANAHAGYSGTAVGQDAKAYPDGPGAIVGATALGYMSHASESYSTAIGSGAEARASHAISIGSYSYITNNYEVAIGYDAIPHGVNNFNIGATSLDMFWFGNTNLETLIGDKFASKSSIVEISPIAESKNVGFVDKYGEDQNVAVEIGKNAKASVNSASLDAASSNTIARSVSVAIGACTVATNPASRTTYQSIAIGFHANALGSQAIAIGSGALHPNECITPEEAIAKYGVATNVGDNAVALAGAIAMGYSAKATGSQSIAMGYGARSSASNAIQLGAGSNASANTLQFRNYRLLNADGTIPSERLGSFSPEEISNTLSRVIAPGNMTFVAGVEEQTIEPMLNGVSEMNFEKRQGDEYFVSGGEAYVVPPLGSRNYSIIYKEIPRAYNPNHEPLPDNINCTMSFSELPKGINATLAVHPSIGYTNNLNVVVTNAPLIVKVRQPSTNSVLVVVKPWNIMEDL